MWHSACIYWLILAWCGVCALRTGTERSTNSNKYGCAIVFVCVVCVGEPRCHSESSLQRHCPIDLNFRAMDWASTYARSCECTICVIVKAIRVQKDLDAPIVHGFLVEYAPTFDLNML